MDVAALTHHYEVLPLSPLRIGSSAMDCRLAGSTYSTLFEGRKLQPVVKLLPQKSNPTLTVRELQEAMFRFNSVETAKTVMMHGEGNGSRI